MTTIAVALTLFVLAMSALPASAQGIDCAKYVRGAQQAIDEVSDT